MATQRPKQTASKREENRSLVSKEKKKVRQEQIQKLKAAQIENQIRHRLWQGFFPARNRLFPVEMLPKPEP